MESLADMTPVVIRAGELRRTLESKQSAEVELLKEARRIAAEQAEDEGLWFLAATCSEEHLQRKAEGDEHGSA